MAQRKVTSLLECGAQVTVVAPELCDAFVPMLAEIKHLARPFQAGDCAEQHLVFACTNNPAVNAAIAHEAQAHGIWCNVADDASLSDFHSAATVRRDAITIGITTAGQSPALARHLKMQIEGCIGPEYEALLEIMGSQRASLKQKLETQAERAELWRAILDSEALALLRQGQRSAAEALIDKLLNL